jgi:hypothetical protein
MTPDGEIKNGESSFDTFESTEIVANPKACASGDRFVEDMREMFGANGPYDESGLSGQQVVDGMSGGAGVIVIHLYS